MRCVNYTDDVQPCTVRYEKCKLESNADAELFAAAGHPAFRVLGELSGGGGSLGEGVDWPAGGIAKRPC